MKRLFVEAIVHTDSTHYGCSMENYNVLDCLHLIFGPKEVGQLLLLSQQHEMQGGVKIMTSYLQYIVLFHIGVAEEFTGAVCFINCKHDTYPYLRSYSPFPAYKWSKNDKICFNKLHKKLRENKSFEFSELITSRTATDKMRAT